MSAAPADRDALVFLCDCGPIIRDLLDLDALQAEVSAMPHVGHVERHVTLCSADGKAFLAEKLREHPDLMPVIAACTPREHAHDFAEAAEAAGRNAYEVSRANIREQVAWVTPDRTQATAKAADMIEASIARVRRQEPLVAPELDVETGVLVVGSGVSGMTAALLLANSGRAVTLVERDPAIGGKVPLLSEIYPDMECAPCLLEPLMDEVLHHPGIEVFTSAEAEEVLGYLGNFTATIRQHARHVDVDGCYGCPTCVEACPVDVPDQYGAGMTTRKAIYIPYPGSVPFAPVVDERSCLHFNGGTCDACVGACGFGVVDLDGTDELIERRVGAVIIATGSQLKMDPGSVYDLPSVMTTWDFERVINPDGPTGGQIQLPDGSVPKRITFVHCADESGSSPAATCSQTCCLAMAKQIHEASHKLPDASIMELAFDRQLGGPHYVHAENPRNVQTMHLGVRDTVKVTPGSNGTASVSVTIHGVAKVGEFDLVVMAPPHVGDADAVALAGSMSVDTDGAGYVLTANRLLGNFASRVDGIFVAGSAQGEKNVAAASAHAAAAAGAVLSALVPGKKLVREAAYAVVDDAVCGGCRICTLSCPFKAVTFDAERGVAVINELLCRGCGTCASACPSSAITARSFTDEQILAEIETLAARGRQATPTT